MKKIILASLLGCALFAFQGCGSKSSNELVSENDSLRTELSNVQSKYDEVFVLMNEVQQGFDQIRVSENYLNVQSQDPEIKESDRQQMENNIKMVNDLLSKNKDQIAKLKKLLGQSNKKASQLQKMVDRLEKDLAEKSQMIITLQEQLAQRDIRITELDNAVNNLKKDVGNLAEESSSQKKQLQEQDKAMNQAWYVFGTKEELVRYGLMTKGSLFKKSEVLKGEINNENFIGVDIRKMDKLELFSKKAKILTTHPAESYSLEKGSDGYYVLIIKDPSNFWKTSRYLVIQID